MNNNQSAVFYTAFSRRLQSLAKEASLRKQAGPFAQLAERAAPKLLSFGARAAEGAGHAAGAAGRDFIDVGGTQRLLGAPGQNGFFGRFGPHVDAAKAWMGKHPGITAGVGGAAGGFGASSYMDHRENVARQQAMAEAPFGSRLSLALQYLMSPENASKRLFQ